MTYGEGSYMNLSELLSAALVRRGNTSEKQERWLNAVQGVAEAEALFGARNVEEGLFALERAKMSLEVTHV